MKLKIFIFLSILSFTLSCSDDDNGVNPTVITPEDPISTADNRLVCENGFAGVFPCNDFDLMAQIDLTGFSNSAGGNDISTASTWRDIKVYNNYAFIVSEAAEHGMQIFDLTQLSNVDPDQTITFSANAVYTEFGNAHNIVINEEQGFAYAVGTSTFGGGPHIIDINDPLNPTFAGGFSGADYTHDAQVVTYNGPDIDYTGREIYIGSNENEVVILDVTDKTAITQISAISYPNVGYTHQGWLTENHRYFIGNDELDESTIGFNTRTLLFDFTDLDNPVFSGTFDGDTQAIDHNLYVKGNEVFLSNYTQGIRVANISGIATGNLFDTGSFDTFPANNNTSFNGVWSIYPYFASNNIIISDINGGFFIVRRTGT